MDYKGPKAFEEIIELLYKKISSSLTRKDKPKIIVGSIGKIYNENEKIITEGDAVYNNLINDNFVKWNSTREEREYKNLLEVCREADSIKK